MSIKYLNRRLLEEGAGKTGSPPGDDPPKDEPKDTDAPKEGDDVPKEGDDVPKEGTDTGQPKDNLVPQDWPDDWVARAAGEDEGFQNILKRYESPKAAMEAFRELYNERRSGKLIKPLEKDAKPDDVAKWREAHGIPEKAEGYYEQLGDLVVGEEDKEYVDSLFAEVVHPANMPPEHAQQMLAWYYKTQEQQQAARIDADHDDAKALEDELRAEWGNDHYRARQNQISDTLAMIPEESREALLNARGPDGKAILNDPNISRWLLRMAQEIDPVDPSMSEPGRDKVETIKSRMEELNKYMRINRKQWLKDNAAQEEWRKLHSALERLQK